MCDEGKMKPLLGPVAVALLFVNVMSGPACADPVSNFYKGSAIRLIISADPGGSYDSDARLVAKHLGKNIARNPGVGAEEKLGGAGRVGGNYGYNSAPKDGLVIAVMQQSLPMGQALGEPG